MSIWGRIFAAGYDHLMSGPEKATLRAHRQALIPHAKGRVLEIGGGTGSNLPFYEGTETLTLTEPDKPMLHRLERRLHEHSPGVLLLRAPAEDLPFEDDSFDAAISTLVLCTVDDQPRALRELHRVLKPGGRLLFIEHIRADDQRLARWQDRLNGLQTRLGHGCNCNRPTIETITAAGFKITKLERDVLRKAPPIVTPLVVGIAQTNGHPA
jgi:ubiquinone/menaquinone biosynthesis C-methylase UbiE